MEGDYADGDKKVVSATFADGKVTFGQSGKTPVVGTCVAPLIAGGAYHPRAQVAFGPSFGPELGKADCCTVHLKGDALIFDGTSVTWQRRKP